MAGDASSASEIIGVNTPVAGANGRVIYVPAADCNFVGKPASLNVAPWFTYHVVETSGPVNASSASARVDITVRAVNDPPTMFPPGSNPGPGTPWWEVCTFDEDFGCGSGVPCSTAITLHGFPFGSGWGSPCPLDHRSGPNQRLRFLPQRIRGGPAQERETGAIGANHAADEAESRSPRTHRRAATDRRTWRCPNRRGDTSIPNSPACRRCRRREWCR
jgi:hypothetical protein